MNNIVLIMAGGLGKRMNSDLPKVLHLLKNKPLIIHVIETAIKLQPLKIGIIVGKYKEIIEKTINQYITDTSNIEYIIQPDALGTGHAISCCKYFLSKYKESNVTILSGDVPFIKSETLCNLNKCLDNRLYLCSILVNKSDNPYGYGRIITNQNNFVKILEEKECNPDEKKIDLVNTGIYAFKCHTLINNIHKISNNNLQNEYYLTEIFDFIKTNEINLLYLKNNYEVLGVNTREQLAQLETLQTIY